LRLELGGAVELAHFKTLALQLVVLGESLGEGDLGRLLVRNFKSMTNLTLRFRDDLRQRRSDIHSSMRLGRHKRVEIAAHPTLLGGCISGAEALLLLLLVGGEGSVLISSRWQLRTNERAPLVCHLIFDVRLIDRHLPLGTLLIETIVNL